MSVNPFAELVKVYLSTLASVAEVAADVTKGIYWDSIQLHYYMSACVYTLPGL